MTVVICPGVHDPGLSDTFVAALSNLPLDLTPLLVLPTQQIPPYSPLQILQFLKQQCPQDQPIFLIGFSAGVVGSTGAAWLWQQMGGQVQALLALDGWGVPLVGQFPTYRFSHDEFTHWSSQLLGATSSSFYADPAVEHLEFWQSPQQVEGWWITPGGRQRMSMIACIHQLLVAYRGKTD